MLVLRRAARESFLIGENGEIEVAILTIDEQQVRIGVKAPIDIPVYRKEVFKQKQAEEFAMQGKEELG